MHVKVGCTYSLHGSCASLTLLDLYIACLSYLLQLDC